MRRGRVITICAAAVAALAASPGALAATPQDICRDLADGTLSGTYSAAEISAYVSALASDPSVQGYCTPVVPASPPVTPANPPVTPANPPVTPANPPVTPANPPVTPANPPTGGVLPGVSPPQAGGGAPTVGVAAEEKTAVAPLNEARVAGVLPFTGTELTIFAVVGLALLASGLLLRTTARGRP